MTQSAALIDHNNEGRMTDYSGCRAEQSHDYPVIIIVQNIPYC